MRRNSNDDNPIQDWLSNTDWQDFNWRRSLLVIGFVAIVLLIVWAGVSSIYTVQPEGQAVVKRFGKFIAVKEPGLHFKLPFGIDTQTFVPTARVLKQEFGFSSKNLQHSKGSRYRKDAADQAESLMLTGDLKVVDVEWVVQYRVNDPNKYLHRVRDVDRTGNHDWNGRTARCDTT